jgi:hypothetical protein
MSRKLNDLLTGQPHTYYCVVTDCPGPGLTVMPGEVTNWEFLRFSTPLRVYSSRSRARRACGKDEKPLELTCLACFLNVMRTQAELKTIRLNDFFDCEVHAWRSPCQTTALLTEGEQTYYIEGCRESGVYWKPTEVKPSTSPAFLQCGATGIDCIWSRCPRGWGHMDDVPITLCEVEKKGEPVDGSEPRCLVRFESPTVQMFYAGIGEEGFNFTMAEPQAELLGWEEAQRVATAIANVQINWSGGMMSDEPQCRTVVLEPGGRELLSIR